MSSQNEIQAVTLVIDAYAEALNSGDAKTIGGFYVAEGAFLPNGYKTLQKKELDQISGTFLNKNNFKIEYKTQNVTVNGEYAIVESVATTNTSNSISQTSRDLFILRNNEGTWKIYRYIFNYSK